ncbi:hybrid sensor histidine kinase/response regulator transcription factor [Mucilaginibacter terrae]|uniref:histidine kinase n=1 Tax=Mucilaginibacter terrae TaxID=1955052 RepID=A0ABU3GR05_9SPHI|nr:two-component regulator propeller domain-containing protein [Mucilaginibacter terrae]MDT3402218.1 signal transduction histidine kinase/ligand-binding sensor domain-containing protein/CheY-like chemotaxis protein/AraC-like DNA-binding protein [Mucilaginibacter terrae]
MISNFTAKLSLLLLWGIIIFFCTGQGSSFAKSSNEISIKYLGIEQGLSNNSATCITQDKYGFIWIGTYDGLNRYDGTQFKTFRTIWGDNRSLINNKVKSIIAHGNLIYIGTEKGLACFDYKDFKFHSLYFKKNGIVKKIDYNVNQLITDGKGHVYAATNEGGLLKFTEGDSVGVTLTKNADRVIEVQAITFDQNNQLCFFANGKGLGIANPLNGNSRIVNSQILSANCLTTAPDGHIWVGANNGLYIYNYVTQQITPFENPQRKLIANNISGLMRTANGEMWIATNGNGINIWNDKKQLLRHIPFGEAANSLQSGAVAGIFEDSEHRKWIATLRGGVNVIDPKTAAFKLYRHSADDRNSVSGNFIRSFCEDENHNLWIGTDGNGMDYWNTRNNTFTTYAHTPGKKTVSGNYVVSIIKDHKNQIWTATFNGGIDVFNRDKQQFKHYTCYKAGNKVEEKNFWKLFEDSKQRIWASSTWGGGVYLYNEQQDRFNLLDDKLVDMHTLYEDHTGALWGGDYTRLVKIDPWQKKHNYYNIGQPVRAIVEDGKHNLWVGTEGGGLLLFNRTSKTFKRYTEVNGLSSNAVLNILVDRHNNLWCSTHNGLSRFDPVTGKFRNFYVSDGLQSNQFLYNSALTLSSGNMVFGGIKGFNVFNPDSVENSVRQPKLRLTDFTINNIPLTETRYAKNIPLNSLTEIKIPFNEATLGIGFTALEYSFPEKISYAYYLEGWDHGWNFVGKLRTAYYSRLNEGSYLLKIKATDTDGGWETRPLIIRLIVMPPWYRTWWAYLFYVAAAAGLITAFWSYRKKQLKLTYEVLIANLQIEKEKEANERKLSFFTNVSHEFRTPLTLIINPIKDLLKQKTDPTGELNTVYKNARRLLGLVDHLLLFRKTESENTELILSKVNFNEFCREVYSCFVQQARLKKIDYTFTSGETDMPIYLDKTKMEIALFNLISNAVKFTPSGGSIALTLREDQTSVYFEIADSGVGIRTDIGEKLFEKYYQVKDGNSLKTGFGIGLYLVKTFIDNHGGSIDYTSQQGRGTVFTLSLPKNSHQLNHSAITIENEPLLEHNFEIIDPDDFHNSTPQTEAGQLELLISEKQTILVIDDNTEISNYIRQIFSLEFTVYQADNGNAGLEMIRKHLPDIIICDIVMPGINGLDLCQMVKSDSATSHIPIILLTGETAPDLRIKGLEEGAVDFISKPFDKELLVARVRGIMKNKKELQNYFYNEVTLKGKSQNLSNEHKDFLYRCIEVIENSLNDPAFEINVIADKLGMSHSNLYKRVKTITGYSINGFIRFVRLRKAAEILINTNCNVNEAAFRVGYSDMKYFREHFNKQFNLNPSEFIKRHRSAFQKSYKLNTKDSRFKAID